MMLAWHLAAAAASCPGFSESSESVAGRAGVGKARRLSTDRTCFFQMLAGTEGRTPPPAIFAPESEKFNSYCPF